MRMTLFAAMMPALSDRHLQKGYASYARNVRTWNGTLRAFHVPSVGQPCDRECLSEAAVGSDVRIGVADGKLVHSSDGSRVGLSRPVAAPIVGVDRSGKDQVIFRYSSVNDYGEESAKSPPSEVAQIEANSYFSINAPTAAYPIRLYAYVNTSTSGDSTSEDFSNPFANEIFVGEQGRPELVKMDLTTWGLSATGYDTDDWCLPEDVKCVVSDEEGYTLAHSDNMIWISERNMPHAYPRRQVISVEHTIIKVIPYYDLFFVITDERPAILRRPVITSGSHQGLVDPVIAYYSQSQPCLGPPVATDFGVIYPSRMGLIGLTPTVPDGLTLLTRGVINEDTWFSTYLPTAAGWLNGVYYGWNEAHGWRFDIKDNNQGSYELEAFCEIEAGGKDVCVCGGQIVYDSRVFDGGKSFLPATWRSMRVVEQGWRIYTVGKVVGLNLEGVLIRLSDPSTGNMIYTKRLTDADNNRPFRIPAYRGMEFSVQVDLPLSMKEAVVQEVHFAQTLPELVGQD